MKILCGMMGVTLMIAILLLYIEYDAIYGGVDDDGGIPIIFQQSSSGEILIDEKAMKKQFFERMRSQDNAIHTGSHYICCMDQGFCPGKGILPEQKLNQCVDLQGFSYSTWTEIDEDKKKHCLSYY